MSGSSSQKHGGNLLSVIVAVAVIWTHTAGMYYCFKYDGVGDRFAVFFIPPYTWYKSLEFTYRLLNGDLPSSSTTQRSSPISSAQDHRQLPQSVKQFLTNTYYKTFKDGGMTLTKFEIVRSAEARLPQAILEKVQIRAAYCVTCKGIVLRNGLTEGVAGSDIIIIRPDGVPILVDFTTLVPNDLEKGWTEYVNFWSEICPFPLPPGGPRLKDR